jgi:RND family efflux transporter MFP subunit
MRINTVKSLILPILILLLGVLAMNQLAELRQEVPARSVDGKTRVVATRSVVPGDIEAQVVAWGRLQSAQPLVLLSEAEGVLLAGAVPFQPGQRFKRGDLLLQVDARQKKLELSSSKSDFINAMASVLPDIQQQYPQQWPRWNSYFEQLQVDKPLPTMPQASIERIERLLARYKVYQLYYGVRIQQIALEKYRIRAPFDGSILSADLHAGANVKAGTRLGELINLEQLDLELQLPVADLPWLDRQREVTVRSSQFPGVWRGRIDRISSSVDNATQTVAVYVRMNKGDSSFPAIAGLLFEAQLPGKVLANAVSVDLKNLYQGDSVYIVSDGKLQQRQVTLARREAERALISDGLAAGDELVTDLLEGVAPGMKALSRADYVQQQEQP